MRAILRKVWESATHVAGRLGGRYYFEDFVRVYPGDVRFDRLGQQYRATPQQVRNFINHRKFYDFAAQFVRGARVVDLGCGSGYGCAILKEAGAVHVAGADASRHAVAFARSHFGAAADFSEQSITDLKTYADGSFDVAVSSEVLEHIKEYGMERRAMAEIRRITRPGGVVVLATPNSEMLGEHGFSHKEMTALIHGCFGRYRLFENALVPFGAARAAWEDRARLNRIGIVVTQGIRLDETVLPDGVTPELKVGRAPGIEALGPLRIDTRLLHNTHSWVVVALNER